MDIGFSSSDEVNIGIAVATRGEVGNERAIAERNISSCKSKGKCDLPRDWLHASGEADTLEQITFVCGIGEKIVVEGPSR